MTADDFFRNAEYTSIQEDVRAKTAQENSDVQPFCETQVGRQAAQWSSLSGKLVGAEGPDL